MRACACVHLCVLGLNLCWFFRPSAASYPWRRPARRCCAPPRAFTTTAGPSRTSSGTTGEWWSTGASASLAGFVGRLPPPPHAVIGFSPRTKLGAYVGCSAWMLAWVLGVGCGVWGVGCGVWGVGCGVWGVRCGVWGVGCGAWGVGRGVWCVRVFVHNVCRLGKYAKADKHFSTAVEAITDIVAWVRCVVALLAHHPCPDQHAFVAVLSTRFAC